MSVVTLQVWHALKRPPIHHPLFRRISQNRPQVEQRPLSSTNRVVLSMAFALASYVSLHYFAQLIVLAIFVVPLAVAGVYMALHGTLAGLYWATRVSGAIARERERGTFQLLSISPYGAFSASWAICTGCQYYDQRFNGLGAQRVWFTRMCLLTLMAFGAVIELVDPHGYSANPIEGFLGVMAAVVVLALAFHIDDIHSTVIGSLVGLIVPLVTRNRLDARVGAFVSFLLLQTIAYLLIWMIGFDFLPQLNAHLAISGLAAVLVLPFEQLVVFFTVRELIARLLWSLNSLLLDGDVSDLRLLTKGGRLIC